MDRMRPVDDVAGDHHARTGDHPALDAIAQVGQLRVEVAVHFADPGHPVDHVQRRVDRVQRHGVHVHVPQPGNHELATQVDHPRARVSDRACRHDPVADQRDRAAAPRAAAGAVDQRGAGEHERGGRGGRSDGGEQAARDGGAAFEEVTSSGHGRHRAP
nr:hypothetical protein [Amycolatopsis albispora]